MESFSPFKEMHAKLVEIYRDYVQANDGYRRPGIVKPRYSISSAKLKVGGATLITMICLEYITRCPDAALSHMGFTVHYHGTSRSAHYSVST